MQSLQTHAFRTPLPYGTGFQGSNQRGTELTGKGIFHLLRSAFEYAFLTNETPLEQLEKRKIHIFKKCLTFACVRVHMFIVGSLSMCK